MLDKGLDREAYREAYKVEIASLKVVIQNLQAALISAGHEKDCPVVHGASVDCVPLGDCVDYRGLWERLVRKIKLRVEVTNTLPQQQLALKQLVEFIERKWRIRQRDMKGKQHV